MEELYAVPFVSGPIHHTVQIPGSKSITNRALPIAALADGATHLTNALFSDDSRHFMDSLQRLGYKLEASAITSTITVYGEGIRPLNHPGGVELFVGNSGTTARFISAFVSLGRGTYRIDGVKRMRERPMGDLLAGLRDLGVNAHDELQTGCPPLKIDTSGIKGGTAVVKSNASSQYLSGLLIAAPYALGPVEIRVPGELVSAPYVDMTIKMMKRFGADIESDGSIFRTKPSRYQAGDYAIEPDASGASYFLAAAAICGGSVTVAGLSADSLQGDAKFARVLEMMGCAVIYDQNGITVTGPVDGLHGVEADLFDMSDMVPTLAAIAPLATSPTRISNVANVRLKETDRIRACVTELRRFGVDVTELADGLVIQPCDHLRTGVSVETYDDHRMAMAFTILGLKVSGTAIQNPECVAKTFPDFYERLGKMLDPSN